MLCLKENKVDSFFLRKDKSDERIYNLTLEKHTEIE